MASNRHSVKLLQDSTPASQPALPADVTTLQTQLRLSRLQCQDLHTQLQRAALRDPAELAQRLAMAREAYRTLRAEARQQREAHQQELEDLQTAHDREVNELATSHMRLMDRLTRERDQARERLDWAESMMRVWQGIADMASRGAGRAAPTADLEEATFKKLISLCHPDRWSQGQLATELAHELSVAVTALRHKGGKL
jgi:hypothetical protein